MENKKMITVTIDGKDINVESGITILEAAKQNGIDIPTLCFLKEINEVGDCRICIVEVEGRKGFVTSCITKVEDGMKVKTASASVLETRRIILDLILSNHNRECLTCTRNKNCELQNLCDKFNMTDIEFEGKRNSFEIDDKSPSIVRDFNKCILCRRCVSTCRNVQDVRAIESSGRGFESCIATAYDKSLADVNCVFCGQCIENCPTGALKEKENIKDVQIALNNENKYVVVQTAPAVRVALGEEFGMPIGENVKGKMVTALKKLGFNKVFDTNTGADLTIMEEANEFIDRINNSKPLPMITSCSPGWVRFAEKEYPDLLKHLSTCKSPQQMFGATIKSYFAKKYEIDPKDICVVSIMPCIAKKYEASREEMESDEIRDIDYVLTTRELAKMIKLSNLDFSTLEDGDFDDPMGEATGAGAIFGTTGGVMEAAIRTAVDILEGKSLDKIEYKAVRGQKDIKYAEIDISGKKIKVAVASSLKMARKIMEDIKSGRSDYQFVEIMACPGGCVMGGGQPIKSSKVRANVDIRSLRAQAIYTIDEQSIIRKSHESPTMKKLYKEFFEKPGSEKAHKYLHTHYKEKAKYDI